MHSPIQLDIQNVTGSSTDADGFTSLSIDAYGERGSVPYPIQHLHGLWSVPIDPVVDPGSGEPIPSQACAVLTLIEGGVGHAIPLSDPRVIGALPIGVAGETILHNSYGAFVRLHKDGSISTSTTSTGGGPDGQSVYSKVSPSGFFRIAPWARETCDATGYRMVHAGGAKFTLGYAGGVFPGLESTAMLQADMVVIGGSAITIGPDASKQQPVAQVLPLVAILSDIIVAIQALNAAIATITSVTPGAGGAATAAPFVAAAASAVASAVLTISTQTAIG